MEQKIVVNMRSGAVHKGVHARLLARTQRRFHVLPAEGGGVPIRISVNDMKAMFWVKDYLGNRDFVARRDFDPQRRRGGPSRDRDVRRRRDDVGCGHRG